MTISIIKGSIKSTILIILLEYKKMHGYEMLNKIRGLYKSRIKISYGAIYPHLHKLQDEGALEAEHENVNNRTRIYYQLTSKGRLIAHQALEDIEEQIQVLNNILINTNSKH